MVIFHSCVNLYQRVVGHSFCYLHLHALHACCFWGHEGEISSSPRACWRWGNTSGGPPYVGVPQNGEWMEKYGQSEKSDGLGGLAPFLETNRSIIGLVLRDKKNRTPPIGCGKTHGKPCISSLKSLSHPNESDRTRRNGQRFWASTPAASESVELGSLVLFFGFKMHIWTYLYIHKSPSEHSVT